MRDIQHHLASTLSVELSVGTISRITDAVADAVLEWQRRPLEESSSRRSTTGAIRVKVRVDHRVASRSAHIAVGAGHGRLSSTWLKYLGPGPGEGASLKGGTCAPVPAQPQGRQGRADRKGGTSRTEAKRAGECHGLTGLPEAIEAPWPQATVQTCVVHPVPHPWMRFVSYRGEPEGRDRSQGRSAPPRTSRPPGRL